jgi:hypothetical protein
MPPSGPRVSRKPDGLRPGEREPLSKQAVGFAGLEIHVHPPEGRVGTGAGHE